MRMILILLIAIPIGTVCITSGLPKNDKSVHSLSHAKTKLPLAIGEARQQSSVTVDGAANPEKIPDEVAYSVFFRMISGRQTEAERRHIMSYLRQIGLEDADSNALIIAAEEYRQLAGVLDNQASQITLHQPPDKKRLKRLVKQKEAMVKDVVGSLRYRLSKDGLEKVRQNVDGRVKRNTTIVTAHSSDASR